MATPNPTVGDVIEKARDLVDCEPDGLDFFDAAKSFGVTDDAAEILAAQALVSVVRTQGGL